jgi:hypothetical protein
VPDGERRVTEDAPACPCPGVARIDRTWRRGHGHGNSQNTEITDYTVTTPISQQRFLLICVVSVASVISVFWLLPWLLPWLLRSPPFVCRLSHDEP